MRSNQLILLIFAERMEACYTASNVVIYEAHIAWTTLLHEIVVSASK